MMRLVGCLRFKYQVCCLLTKMHVDYWVFEGSSLKSCSEQSGICVSKGRLKTKIQLHPRGQSILWAEALAVLSRSAQLNF